MPRARKGETAAEGPKAKKTRKRSAPEAGQKEHVASHSGSTEKLAVAQRTVDGKHKRNRAEQTGTRPKKNRKRDFTDSTDYMDHTAVDEPPGSHGSEATDKPPPMVVVPLPSGTAELLKDTRWLEHFKAVAESVVDVQIFTVKDTEETSDCHGDPEVFEVSSPNGQTNCTGKYYLLPGKVNEHSIWKKDGQDRWIYSGTNGTWLVGGPAQQKQGFACRSGLLHQAVLHKGEMPDKLLFGSWKRVDGKTWKEDPEISVKAATPLLPGQPVQVTGDGRNGWLGRLISRRQSDEGNFWQVQLANGQEELPEQNLQLKKIVQDEVWLTVLTETSTQRAVQMCEVLAATLMGGVVKFSHLATAKATGHSGHSGHSGHMVVGECPFLLPGKVQQRLGAAELCRFMEKFSVILGFEERMGQGGQGGQGLSSNDLQLSLLIFGPNPAPAVLALLGRIEELIPDCLRSIASHPEALEPPDSQFGASVCSRSLPAEKDWLQRLATAMQVQASTVGGVSILLGGRPEREKSLQLIQTAESGSSKVLPNMLEPHCASTRVPEAAQIAVGKELEALKEELGVIAVWCVQTESATTKEVTLAVREDLIPGTTVRAVYEDGDWYDATVLEVHPVSDMVDVQWKDASSSRVLIRDVKLKLSTDSQQRRKREALLQTARRLAIFGPARERKIAVARVMVLVEEHCRGLWTEDLLQTVEELRGSTHEETSIDVKLCPFIGGPYPALHILKTIKGLKESLQRAASASGSYMCLLGKPALLVVGNQQERSQGLDYLEWIAADKLVWETFFSSAKSWLEDEVQWSDGEDQFLLFMDGNSLGFTTNGILKVREVATASYSGSELCLSGSGSTIRIATDEGVVKRVFQLFLRSQLSKALGTSRGDTTTIETTFGQAVWLEPVELRTIERQTKTLVIVPQIDRSTSNWQPDASCKILVCGRETCREEAATELANCLESLANRMAQQKEEEEEIVEEEPAQAAPVRRAPPPKAAVAVEEDAERWRRTTGPSNPLEELRKLKFWPKDNESWGALQEQVWRGHPPLLPGWIRVWSRAKDQECFVNMSSGETTFDFKTAAG